MSWVHVQDAPGSNGVGSTTSGASQTSGAFGSPVTIGNSVIVFTWGFHSGGGLSAGSITCSDNGSTPNTYTQLKIALANSNANWAAIFIAPITHNPSSGNLNPKVSTPSGSFIYVCASEFSGGTNTIETSNSATGTTAAVQPGAITTTLAADLLVACMEMSNNANVTVNPPTNFTHVGTEAAGTTDNVGQGVYWIPAATESALNPSWGTFSGQSTFGAVIVALEAAVAGGPLFLAANLSTGAGGPFFRAPY